MPNATPITVAHGNGIGPEIMDATLRVLEAAGAQLDIDTIEIGEKVYKEGYSAGIRDEAWDSLRKNKVFLKAPITTPQGGGVKSLNVTIRKSLGLFANVRHSVTYHPFVHTIQPNMDVVIVRENEEDLYAGIEHRQTQDVYQCLKLITRPGSERIIRYAFEYAVAHNRKKVTCFSKDNIMKLTDGLFHRIFNEVAEEYPQIESDHWIIDIGSARVAAHPETMDVVVMPNLYGDIVSDIAAEVSGSVGHGGSANIGAHVAMFEAIHGSAPDIAGKDIANPSGLMLSSVMMLVHVGQPKIAETVHNAWLKTIEDGIHTGDVYQADSTHSKEKVGTRAFADAVIARLGQQPATLKSVSYDAQVADFIAKTEPRAPEFKTKNLIGVDVFVDSRTQDADALAKQLQSADNDKIELKLITNRGVKVWPGGFPETFKTDHWRCRFYAKNRDAGLEPADVITALQALAAAGVDFIKTEHLYTFDGALGYSLGQGE